VSGKSALRRSCSQRRPKGDYDRKQLHALIRASQKIEKYTRLGLLQCLSWGCCATGAAPATADALDPNVRFSKFAREPRGEAACVRPLGVRPQKTT
jgi:hypothetical protein